MGWLAMVAETDLCEACHATFLSGTLPHNNPKNPLSRLAEDHAFDPFVDPTGKQFQPLKKVSTTTATVAKGPKVKPNDKCPCGSGKKYKKCCRKL